MNRIPKKRQPEGARKIAVLLVDDHAIVREALQHLIQGAPDVEVIGEAADGPEAIEQAKRLRPDVILLDLAMPLMCGTDAIRHLAKVVPTAKVLILSAYEDAQTIQAAFEAGATGYLVKQSASQEVLTAIRRVDKGEVFFGSRIIQKFPHQPLRASPDGQRKPPELGLTERQIEVLQLIAQGLANKQIADALSISIKTVGIHRQSILDRLNIHKTASLTRYAIARGLIPCDRPKLAA